ncbi:hypothetical protein [Streptomyces sp. NPDC058657]|uniref:hypothetical protein n=1 Tax=unclassified Streptomyces TaxID=2593676 RepID=UPI0036688714
MSLLFTVIGSLTLGYVLGRWQPAYRALSWAMRETALDGVRRESGLPLPTGIRHRTAGAIKTADRLVWIARHPVQHLNSWRHRNDPPPWLTPQRHAP